MHGVMLVLAASIRTGASAVFSCINTPDVDPSFRATFGTSTRTVSPGEGGRGMLVGALAGESLESPTYASYRPGATEF
jgi:hypothetical protein